MRHWFAFQMATRTVKRICKNERSYTYEWLEVHGSNVAWSLPIVCDNYRYIYNKLHIHSRKCDCFFPLEIMFCSSYLVSCQGRAPQGPTYRVIYLCPFDHLRTLKMRFWKEKLNIYCVTLSMSRRIIIIIVILIINPYVDYAEWQISQESMLVCQFVFIYVTELNWR